MQTTKDVKLNQLFITISDIIILVVYFKKRKDYKLINLPF